MKCWTALALFAVVGCGPSTRSYTVVVRNDSPGPITVVLTKDGPPVEWTWLPPEDYAALRKAPPEARVNGTVVPPGKSVDQTRTGQFNAGTDAVLRIYRGEHTVATMLGIGPDSPNRQEVRLRPGDNTIVIDPRGEAARR